jgi:uncharacterized phage protein (TIGR02220 family)
LGKSFVKDDNYYVVQGWMRNKLGLKGNALDIYAIIYGFSQVSHQEFTASINYLSEWLGVSRVTVINALKDLVEKGYLTKESEEKNGVIYNRYTAVVPDFTGGKEILLPSKEIVLPSKKILPNNIDNNITNKKEKSLSKDKDSVERSSTIPYLEIIQYLNTKAETKYKSSSKDNMKHIKARWEDGYRLEDFFSVIDVKVAEWKEDKKMCVYLRPSTLFSPKFEGYLQQAQRSPKKKRFEGISEPASKEDRLKNEDGSHVVF